ncbi:alpha-(1,3)-fucosyltransferase fut-1-like [Haliotis rufescens]|uniref:alpha-(1,3)-fucosyltransferase fut-1-like n=1 Tax=Haliotis rufescens TaxID=6454 RepID=UPI00201E754A|nr:alpha-(1,3)-fucosyltransferase fut-1-like [Haliotis rufescens]
MQRLPRIVAVSGILLCGMVVLYCSVAGQDPVWLMPLQASPVNYTIDSLSDTDLASLRADNDINDGPYYKLVVNASTKFPYFYKPISFHSTEKYRQKVSFNVNFENAHQTAHENQSKMILFYNAPKWFNFRDFCPRGLQKCPQKGCECSYDPAQIAKADAVIIDVVELDNIPPAKQAKHVWIMFGLECPKYFQSQYYESSRWRRMFNWTMTYRLDSDIALPYSVLFRKAPQKSANFTKIALKKTKSILWFVSNCKTPSRREDYVTELRKHIPVDIYGKCGPSQCTRDSDCQHSSFNEYRFYLAFENSLCIDYISEKLYKTYSHNIVPVVRGGADYNSLIPKGTYINAADFSSPKELGKYLNYLETNATAYGEILEEKSRYRNDNHEADESAFCDICVKLHNLDKYYQYYYDNVRWLNEGTCHNPNDV